MVRCIALLIGVLFGSLLIGPASAATIATFSIGGGFFYGGEVTGTFSLNLNTHKVEDVAITTTTGAVVLGTSYPGFAIDTFALEDIGTGPYTRLTFNNSPTALPPLSGQVLTVLMPAFDAASLASLPHFMVAVNESAYFFLCGGLCAGRDSFATVKTLSLVTTPIPATLPLLATALGGMGFIGWRRKRGLTGRA